jgi:hypothetical protein
MLRRNFIRTALIAFGSTFFIGTIPAGGRNRKAVADPTRRGRTLPFNGHPRSGCATRPELSDLLYGGIMNIPGQGL